MGATQSTPTPPSGVGKNNKNNSGTYGAGIQGDAPSALPHAAPFGRPDDGLRGGRGVIGNRAAGEVDNQQAGRSGGFATQQQAGTPRDRIELYPFSTVPQKGTDSSGDFSYKIGHPVPTDDELKDMVRDERYWAKDDATRNRWRDHVAGQFARTYGGKRPTVELYGGAEHTAPSVHGPALHNPAPHNPASHDPATRSSGEHSPQHPGKYPSEYPPGHPVHRYARQWAARQAERQLQAERAQAESVRAGSAHAETVQAEQAQSTRAGTPEGHDSLKDETPKDSRDLGRRLRDYLAADGRPYVSVDLPPEAWTVGVPKDVEDADRNRPPSSVDAGPFVTVPIPRSIRRQIEGLDKMDAAEKKADRVMPQELDTWRGTPEDMAKLNGLNPEDMNELGEEGVEALARAISFRKMDRSGQDATMALIYKIGKNGNEEFAERLREIAIESRDVSPYWHTPTMNDEEVRDYIRNLKAVHETVNLASDIAGKAPSKTMVPIQIITAGILSGTDQSISKAKEELTRRQR